MGPVLVPIAPRTDVSSSAVSSRRNQPKSRNGCTTCKARRMKCDESKPTCQQCTRRRVVCGGYQRNLKWKPIGQSSNDRAPQAYSSHTRLVGNRLPKGPADTGSERSTSAFPPQSSRQSQGEGLLLPDRSDVLPHVNSLPTNSSSTADTNEQPQPSDLSVPNIVDVASPKPVGSGLFLDDGDLEMTSTSLHLGDPDLPVEDLDQTFDDEDWNIYGLDMLLGLSTSAWEQGTSPTLLPQSQTELGSGLAASLQPEVPDPPDGDDPQAHPSHVQPLFVDPDMIQHLFENSTCDILSIREDRNRNPWRTLIWPLAAHYPALYHALAAMSCFHMSQVEPQLKIPAVQHFERSTEALSDTGDMPAEAIVATRLALALAASWDHEKASTVIQHTKAARALIRRVVSEDQISQGPAAQLSRFSFLANTCLYMDVIARLTCVDPESSNDGDFNAACSMLSSSIPSKQQLDPLMGCAITLFPMIGRLAEIVGRVRTRAGKTNSPSIISKGSELRVAIEGWAPALDLESAVELEANLTDSIQTAEAYRWASLLLLRQSVPELPWRHSIWELASKSLVYLATIPLTSRTTIVQIFPLMLAGCEAFEDDDREWVRDRWNLMSRRMVTGIVDRCRETTLEVWRRRDEYEIPLGLRQNKQQNGLSTEGGGFAEAFPARQDDSLVSFATATNQFDANMQPASELSDFPASAAFKEGIDPVTRAGHLHYTVKGDLHCFGVMRDWDWHVFLG